MHPTTFLQKRLAGDSVQWKPLGEIATIGTGSRNTNEAVLDGKFPFFVRSQKPRTINEYEFDETAIITAGDGVGVGKVFHYVSGKYALHQRAYRIVVTNQDANSRYIFHYIKNDFPRYLKKNSVHASVTSLRMPMFKKFPIPIPCPENREKSLAIQGEIVRILDAFTERTHQLTAALQSEQIARQKQYHYYRNQLLTFAPEEVQWKPLGEVGEFIRGNGLQKKDLIEEGFPAIHYGQIHTKFGLSGDKTFTYVSPEQAHKMRKAQKNDLLLATTSEDDEFVAKPLAWLGEQTAISSDMMLFRHQQNVKYLAYFVQTHTFQAQKRKSITGTKVRRISSSDLAKIKIPLPSLEAQGRIVAILDQFEALTHSMSKGLPREIALRQKQYVYYRDLLLDFPQDEKV